MPEEQTPDPADGREPLEAARAQPPDHQAGDSDTSAEPETGGAEPSPQPEASEPDAAGSEAEQTVSQEAGDATRQDAEAAPKALGRPTPQAEAGDEWAEVEHLHLAEEGIDTAADALEKAEVPEPTPTVSAAEPPRPREVDQSRSPSRPLPIAQIFLLVNTGVVALVASLLFYVYRAPPPPQETTAIPQPPVQQEAVKPVAKPPAPAAPEVAVASVPLQEPVSWRLAEDAYQASDYDQSLRRYGQLSELSRARPVDALIHDFFQVRRGQCLKQLGDSSKARGVFLELSRNPLPVVRAVANYELALYDAADGQYLLGRMRAYRAIAALALMDKTSPLEADCDFLIGRLLTEKALSFCDPGVNLSWKNERQTDPFAGLTEPALRNRLEDGADRLAQALLGPKVKRVEAGLPGTRWQVACSQAPLEELLHRLTYETGADVKWVDVNEQVRRRAVVLSFPAASEQQIGEVACGMVGLLARFTGDQILVYNPQSITSTREQRYLLAREAISTWRRLFLRYPDDARIAHGHFALACLHEYYAETLDAMREYQLIAHRFRRASVAPLALLRCAKLRIRLRNYAGARSDLLDLLDRFPNHEATDRIYLYLGQATSKAGLLDEAIRVFRKLYYLNLSLPSQMGACFGAARCFYKKADYEEASKWLTRYIGLAKKPAEAELAEAHLLLGKCAVKLGDLEEAAAAFGRVLGFRPSSAQRVEATLQAARAEAKRGEFVASLAALERIDPDELTPDQAYEYVLAFAQVYRLMGLPDKALSALRRGIDAVSDSQRRAVVLVEMARCHAEVDEPEMAYQLLTETLPRIESAALARQAACDLAEICLKLGKTVQAITVARELLKPPCPATLRRRALEALGAAYLLREDYTRAALAYSGMLSEKPEREDR